MTAERSFPGPWQGADEENSLTPPNPGGQGRKEKPCSGALPHCLEEGNDPAPERNPSETQQDQMHCEGWPGPQAAVSYTGSVVSYDVAK